MKIFNSFKNKITTNKNQGIDDGLRTNKNIQNSLLQITELIPASNKDIIHGRFILDRTQDCENIEVQAYNGEGTIISSNYYSYANEQYFEDEYNNKTKKVIEFSMHLDRGHDTVQFFQIEDDKKIENASLTLNSEDFQKLINEAEERYPSNFAIDTYMTNLLNQQRSTPNQIKEQTETDFSYMPLFSIIVPLYNTKLEYFIEMVQSVIDQSYQKWELILVNASPENCKLKQEIENYSSKYDNIKDVVLNSNYGITLNTSEGINRAAGDYICFLDHDDVIEPDTLFHYVKAINNSKTDVNLLYCDEDKINEKGSHTECFLKPDFSIDSLLHRNYICHFLAIRNTILRQIDFNDAKLDGAQDHYIALKCSDHPESILHIPRILYHWRKTEESTATSSDNKNYANESGLNIINSYLHQNGINGTAKNGSKPYSHFINYPILDNTTLTVIIDASDVIFDIETMLETIYLLNNYNRVVDINIYSSPENLRNLEFKTISNNIIKVICIEGQENLNRSINENVPSAKGNYLLFLNCNVLVKDIDTIEELLGRTQRKDVGAVGPMIVYPDDTIASAGINVCLPRPSHINRGLSITTPGYMNLNTCEQNFSAISGICMMASKENFINTGGFNLEYKHLYSDIDYCLKLRDKGKLIIYTPTASVTYYGEFMINSKKNRKYQLEELKNRSKLIKNWSDFFLEGDPYINENFGNITSNSFTYSIA